MVVQKHSWLQKRGDDVNGDLFKKKRTERCTFPQGSFVTKVVIGCWGKVNEMPTWPFA